MKVSLTVSLLAAALAAAPVAATAAPPLVRPFAPPVVLHGAGAESRAAWRDHGGDHDFWRHRRRGGFDGWLAGGDQASELDPESAPAPFVVAAPVFVDVAFAPAAGPQPSWTGGPKLIEIGRGAPRHGRLPLVIYGD